MVKESIIEKRISLPFLETSTRRNINLEYCYMILLNDYVDFRLKATQEKYEEEKGMWEYREVEEESYFRRDSITKCVRFNSSLEEMMFGIEIEINGGQDIGWLFDDQEEQKYIYNIFKQYMSQTNETL